MTADNAELRNSVAQLRMFTGLVQGKLDAAEQELARGAAQVTYLVPRSIGVENVVLNKRGARRSVTSWRRGRWRRPWRSTRRT